MCTTAVDTWYTLTAAIFNWQLRDMIPCYDMSVMYHIGTCTIIKPVWWFFVCILSSNLSVWFFHNCSFTQWLIFLDSSCVVTSYEISMKICIWYWIHMFTNENLTSMSVCCTSSWPLDSAFAFSQEMSQWRCFVFCCLQHLYRADQFHSCSSTRWHSVSHPNITFLCTGISAGQAEYMYYSDEIVW